MDIYTVFCIILGEATPFSVKIPKDDTVDYLKKMIKAEKSHALNDIDADTLELYQVDIPDDDDLEETMKNWRPEGNKPLKATKKALNLFEGAPKDETVHIVVVPPKSTGSKRKYRSSEPGFSSSDSNKSHEASLPPLELLLKTIHDSISQYLKDKTQLPLWQPTTGSERFRKHISDLKIPKASNDSTSPSLLLHNLGKTSYDPGLEERIKTLFSRGTSFLCNTSGSGKTRLLLEGLMRHWGYYFTAYSKLDGIGSSDFRKTLKRLGARLRPLKNEDDGVTLQNNRTVASRHSQAILYSRMMIFRQFLECASSLPGGITNEHKGQWLLLQIAPTTLLGTDLFWDLVLKLLSTERIDFLEEINVENSKISKLVAKESLFCVLDEAQIPSNNFEDYFRSEKGRMKRPVLREIIAAWTDEVSNLILSGTGISMQQVLEVLGSPVMKPPNRESTTVTDVGAFDTGNSQKAYLSLYLLPDMLNPLLVSALKYWLRGRYRFTTTYLHWVLKDGFQSPFTTLKAFILASTGFTVPEGLFPSEQTLSGTPASSQPEFNFSNLLEASVRNPRLIETVSSFVFEYTFTGKIRGLSGLIGDDMVEYGISRFKKLSEDTHRNAETDEPLAILGLIDFFEKKGWTPEGYLTESLNDAHASARGFAFEPFGAYVLARAFATPRRIADVFDFGKECSLGEEVAELVTVRKLDDTFVYQEFDISSNIRESHTLGCSPSTNNETLEWLRDPKGTVFCFPAQKVGPDLIFALRLTRDSTILRVCTQFKLRQDLTRGGTLKAIESTNPDDFLSKSGQMQDDMITAIKQLGTIPNQAGVYGVLRVLISYPASPDKYVLDEAWNDGHPVATVDIEKLIKLINSLKGPKIAPLANNRVVQNRKRKRDEENTTSALPCSISEQSDSRQDKRQKVEADD